MEKYNLKADDDDSNLKIIEAQKIVSSDINSNKFRSQFNYDYYPDTESKANKSIVYAIILAHLVFYILYFIKL